MRCVEKDKFRKGVQFRIELIQINVRLKCETESLKVSKSLNLQVSEKAQICISLILKMNFTWNAQFEVICSEKVDVSGNCKVYVFCFLEIIKLNNVEEMEKSQECRHSIRRSCRIGKILQISNFWFEAAAPSSAFTAARHYGFWEGPSLDRKLAPVIEKTNYDIQAENKIIYM